MMRVRYHHAFACVEESWGEGMPRSHRPIGRISRRTVHAGSLGGRDARDLADADVVLHRRTSDFIGVATWDTADVDEGLHA